jgi:23S rRNA (adenine2503-C2)-methyltransferase
MGMGEPLLNYSNVLESVRILMDPDEFGLGARRITISTSGIIAGIKKLTQENLKIKLAISLHAAKQELREKVMPVARINPLKTLFEAIDNWQQQNNRRVSYEYILIQDINDQPEHADALAKLLKGRISHVNLIPYNQIDKYSKYKPSDKNSIFRFENILKQNGIPVSIRVTMGDKIKAACGQLATK